ncbi:MAG TPA: hypothetical protein VI653_24185 [Steroidobacteraceae bacterium]
MDTEKLGEKPGMPEAKNPTDSGHRMVTVNLVEMGSVSNETKGFLRGLEYGFTPRSG